MPSQPTTVQNAKKDAVDDLAIATRVHPLYLFTQICVFICSYKSLKSVAVKLHNKIFPTEDWFFLLPDAFIQERDTKHQMQYKIYGKICKLYLCIYMQMCVCVREDELPKRR